MITTTLEKSIIKDKERGLSDVEIGAKYKITYRQLEKIILKARGVNISILPHFGLNEVSFYETI